MDIDSNSASRARSAARYAKLGIASVLSAQAAFLFAAAASAQEGASRATLTVRSHQAEGAAFDLAIGLTADGDGSTCGSATAVEVERGDVVDLCYTVTNRTGENLAYSSLEDSLDGMLFRYSPIAIAAGDTYTYHRRIRVSESLSYAATWTAQAAAPDYLTNDLAPSAFVDIRSSGSRLNTLDTPLSVGAQVLTLPFEFPFYGVESDQLCVTNLGVMFFALPRCDSAGNQNRPLNTIRRSVIAPFWDVLWYPSGGVYWEVRGTAPNRTVIVQWDRAHQWCDVLSDMCFETNDRANVEALLGEDGSISFQYLSTYFNFFDWITDTEPFDYGRSAAIGLRHYEESSGQSFVNQYSYRTELTHADPSAIAWTPTTVSVHSASAGVDIDAGSSTLDVTPAALSMSAPSRSTQPVSATLTVANGGNRDLAWSILGTAQTALAASPPVARPLERAVLATNAQRQAAPLPARSIQDSLATDLADAREHAPQAPSSNLLTAGTECAQTVPGVVIHDDGNATNGYAGGSFLTSVIVDKFTPTYYPATFTSVCVAFSTYIYPDSPAGAVEYEVVVYDDSGDGGGPGNELGAVAANTVGTPFPGLATFNDRVDISGLRLNVASGSVYIGVRWRPDQSPDYTVYLDADENGTDGLPPNAPEGGYFDAGEGVFYPISHYAYDYVAMMIRAVETAPGCAAPMVPWMSVSPATGVVAANAAPDATVVTLDPSGLADGVYNTSVCVGSRYRTLAVPLQFSVGGTVDPIFANGFEP